MDQQLTASPTLALRGFETEATIYSPTLAPRAGPTEATFSPTSAPRGCEMSLSAVAMNAVVMLTAVVALAVAPLVMVPVVAWATAQV